MGGVKKGDVMVTYFLEAPIVSSMPRKSGNSGPFVFQLRAEAKITNLLSVGVVVGYSGVLRVQKPTNVYSCSQLTTGCRFSRNSTV